MKRILSKEHTLELDDEEVDQLLDVFERRFQGFAGNRVITFGTERRGEALRKHKLASELSSCGDYNILLISSNPLLGGLAGSLPRTVYRMRKVHRKAGR